MNRIATGTRTLRRLDPRRLLTSTRFYRFVQHALAPRRSFESFVTDYLQPERGDRVLDIGCGPADDLEYMPPVTYVGFDLNDRYIESARRRWGDRGRFFCATVSQGMLEGEVFDLVIANGVMHHLSDEDANSLMALAVKVLAPGGRLVTKDPVRLDRQRRAARWLIDRDRGEHVRTPEEYAALAQAHFEQVELHVRSDLLRVPYDHAILRCALRL